MPAIYPPVVPTISGDFQNISRFLNSPALIGRAIRDQVENRFIADVLLTGRYSLEGGAIAYEQQGESRYTDRAIEAIEPFAEYPKTPYGAGPAAIASGKKWGQDVPVSDEAIRRLNFNPVQRAITKVVNQIVKTVDSNAVSAVASAVTQTATAGAAWTPGTANTNPLYDIMKAVAFIRGLDQGYEPNMLIVSDAKLADLANNPTVLAALARQRGDQPIYSGALPANLFGLDYVLSTPYSPFPNAAFLVDNRVLGGMADENLGGPGYAGQAKGVEGKSIRDDERDGWWVRGRRVTVPVVLEPGAGYIITGI